MSEIRGHRQAPGMVEPPPAYAGPSVLERVVRFVLHCVWIVVGVLTIYLILSLMNALAQLGDGLEKIQAPAPAVTECVGELC